MLNKLGRLILTASAVFALAGAAHASIINIFNTGVNASGTSLPDGTIGDPHYTLASVPGGSTTAVQVRTAAGGFPVGPWILDSPLSAWIGPSNNNENFGPNGDYDYRMTFDLTGFNVASAGLSGRWATDNAGLNILINGHSLGIANTVEFTDWTPFMISSNFMEGVNTLDFIVNNSGGPTGLRVEMAGTANPVPEPVSFALLGAGLVALGMFRRRKV